MEQNEARQPSCRDQFDRPQPKQDGWVDRFMARLRALLDRMPSKEKGRLNWQPLRTTFSEAAPKGHACGVGGTLWMRKERLPESGY
jgi:hypothetical protein